MQIPAVMSSRTQALCLSPQPVSGLVPASGWRQRAVAVLLSWFWRHILEETILPLQSLFGAGKIFPEVLRTSPQVSLLMCPFSNYSLARGMDWPSLTSASHLGGMNVRESTTVFTWSEFLPDMSRRVMMLVCSLVESVENKELQIRFTTMVCQFYRSYHMLELSDIMPRNVYKAKIWMNCITYFVFIGENCILKNAG